MSWTNDVHVARGLLGALTAVATAVVIGCTQVVPLAFSSGPVAVPSRSVSVDSFAFKPLELDRPATMAAAVPSSAFEEQWSPIPPAPVPAPAPEPVIVTEPEPEQVIASVPTETLFETGIASTYGVGDGFQGNRTACGQIFNTHIVQVAHKTLKCGTLIRIEDAETGKSIVAEVTDRGPYIRGRIVDLSWAAFRELDLAGGLRPVNVYVQD
jgi:rare lipoprotein A